jgi:hypothetical protein
VRELGRCTANQNNYSDASTTPDDNARSSADHGGSTCGDRSGGFADGPDPCATKYSDSASKFHDESSADHDWASNSNHH